VRAVGSRKIVTMSSALRDVLPLEIHDNARVSRVAFVILSIKQIVIMNTDVGRFYMRS
jgi:hypothetical protein